MLRGSAGAKLHLKAAIYIDLLAEGLGFRAEALLRNHVKDHDGNTHDLALLSHDVSAVQSMMHALGVSDALGT
jgi:hypothetical protein